jgi:hypothetical protein
MKEWAHSPCYTNVTPLVLSPPPVLHKRDITRGTHGLGWPQANKQHIEAVAELTRNVRKLEDAFEAAQASAAVAKRYPPA